MIQTALKTEMTELDLKSICIEVDAEERDDVASWVSAKSYEAVLSEARSVCRPGRHLVTLKEYMTIWRQTVQSGGNRACNEADIWLKLSFGSSPDRPESSFRHPFKSTVLVDTWLQDFSFAPEKGYEATVFERGVAKDRVAIPATGKVYELNRLGLPSRTGGRKTAESESFEHRWWEFSSDRLRSSDGSMSQDARLALFANGGTIGCFCELVKAHYFLEEAGGFYRVLSLSGN
jgi:hypothetical protein